LQELEEYNSDPEEVTKKEENLEEYNSEEETDVNVRCVW
jgi:hypothetical protein